MASAKLSNVVEDQHSSDRLGRLSSIIIGRESQIIKIIALYQIVDSTEARCVKVHAQWNKMLGENHNAKYHRQQLLHDLSEHVKKSREQRNAA